MSNSEKIIEELKRKLEEKEKENERLIKAIKVMAEKTLPQKRGAAAAAIGGVVSIFDIPYLIPNYIEEVQKLKERIRQLQLGVDLEGEINNWFNSL